jgi:Protein of unknown function (DUF3592)
MGFTFNFGKKPTLKKPTDPKTFLIFLGFIILLMLPFSLYLVAESIRTYTTFDKTVGIIASSTPECERRRRRTSCYNKETVEYKIQKETYTFSPKTRTQILGKDVNADRQIGDSVKVLYNPKKPNEAVIDDYNVWLGSAILSGFSLFLLTIFVVQFPKYFKLHTFLDEIESLIPKPSSEIDKIDKYR